MADFEGLIRQALASQDSTNPAIRQKVYQSSRNALAKLIAAAGPQPIAIINDRRTALENSINRIEAGFVVPASELPHSAQPGIAQPQVPLAPVVEKAASQHAISSGRLVQPAPDQVRSQLAPKTLHRQKPELADDLAYADGVETAPASEFEIFSDDRPVYQRRSGTLLRILPVLLLIAVLAGAAWLAFSLVNTLVNNNKLSTPAKQPVSEDSGGQADDANSVFVTLLSPTDTSALQVNGRGKADIVNQANIDMIRVVSVRSQSKPSDPAEPILIEIASGALSKVAGKRVTVEIQAKSGSENPATFAIGCDFAGQDACGRKRFRVGLQPEAIVFTVSFPLEIAAGAKAYLTLSTDVTSSSGTALEGDAIDIGYARLRFPKQ